MSTQAATESLQAILREIPASFPVERIDTIWLFAPRDIAGRENGLVVLSVIDPEQHPADGLLDDRDLGVPRGEGDEGHAPRRYRHATRDGPPATVWPA